MKYQHKTLHMVTYILVIAGALNWGLVGILDLNLVNLILGGSPIIEKLVYIVIGLCAVYDIAVMHKGYCMYCSGKKK